MPKQTFFNLPDEKRENILRVCTAEFAQHGYKAASISRIVEDCGIAKGSFYQYFSDKEDLYGHIIEYCLVERKLKAFKDNEEMLTTMNLSEFLRCVFKIQLKNFADDPDIIKIGMDLHNNSNDPVCRNIIKKYDDLTVNYFVEYIRHEKEEGELDPMVDETLLNFMLVSVGNYMAHWMSAGKLEYNSLTEAHIDLIVDKLDYILTNGIYGNDK